VVRSFLFASALVSLFVVSALAQQPSTSEKQFEELANRYHLVLSRRPTKGTAFDRMYELYLDAGKLDELTTRYETAVADNPEELASRILLALVDERRGRLDEALQSWSRARELAGNDYYPDYESAILLARQHRYDEAIATFEQALSKNPQRPQLVDIYKRLGRLQAAQGETEKALATWSELADKFPDDRFALEELAELLAEEEQFEPAIERYRQLATLAKDPYRKLTASVEIGQLQVRQGKLETAVETFEQSLQEVRPDSWLAKDIWRRIEEVFLRSNDLSGLAAYYEERLKQHPKDLTTMTRYAGALAKLGRGDEALEQYRTTLEVAPSRDDIRELVIDELIKHDDYDAAIEQAKTLVEQHPRDVKYLRQLGELHLKAAGDDKPAGEERALAVWRKIAELEPSDAQSALQLAEICRNAAGIKSQLKTSATETDAPENLTTLGQAALDFYAEAVRRAPTQPHFHEYHGEFLHAIGRKDEALAAWRKLAEPPHDNVENLKRLAQVLDSADNLDEALEVLDSALAKDYQRYDLHGLAVDLQAKREDYDAALNHIAALEQIADTPYLEEQALVRRVQTYSAANMLDERLQELISKLHEDTASGRDYWLAALIEAARQRPGAALRYLETALQRLPDDTRLLRFKAEVHERGGDLAGAAEQYRLLAKIEPKNRLAHLEEVVKIDLELGQFAAARETAEERIRLAPGNAAAVQLLADVHFRSGQDEQGLEAFRRAVRVESRNADIRMQLARQLIQRQQIDEGIEHLWRAFQLTDDLDGKLTIVGELAEQYVISGGMTQLVEALEGLRRSQQDELGPTLFLVRAYAEAEDFSNARRELNGLLAGRPDDVQALAQLVALAERLGDVDGAVQHQERIVELAPQAAQQQRLAGLYSDAGRNDEAREIWVRLLNDGHDEKRLLSVIDRAMTARDYDQVIALAEPQWTASPDDWRFAHRLMLAKWYSKEHEQACEVAKATIQLLPSGKYEEPPSQNQGSARASYYQQYPAVLMRMSMPMQIRSMLSSSRTNFSAIAPRELEDAQMFAFFVTSEAARASGEHEKMLAELRERAESDLTVLRQLVWVLFSEQKMQEAEPLLEHWLAESPEDVEARLASMLVPFYNRGVPTAAPAEMLAKMKPHYEWLVANRPELGRIMTRSYAQLLLQLGKQDEAAKLLRQVVADARNISELSQMSYFVMQMRDAELLTTMLARIEELSGGSGSSSPYTGHILQSYAQLAAREKDWEKLLDSFNRFMAASHPKSIRPGSMTTSKTASRMVSPYSSSSRGNNDPIGHFPSPSAWLDASRLGMFETVHNALRSAGQEDQLGRLIDTRLTETEGIPQQCWRLTKVVWLWRQNERVEALTQLQKFVDQTPGNIESRMLLARATAETGDAAEALAALGDIHLPFGNAAKTLEQLRMELATRADDEEMGRRAALRLFGMRLGADEQAELAKAMRRFGLAARSEQLMNRAVRTASNNPQQLYQLLQQNSATDLPRAAEIARTILRSVRRSDQANNAGNTYRTEALRVLDRVDELKPMIEKVQQQYAEAPKSVKLMDDLVELYTAANQEDKATEMIDKILAVRPKDAALHYRVANSLLQRNKLEEGLKRMQVVWDNDPRLVLQQGYSLGQMYAKAGKLDDLAHQLAKLKDNAVLLQDSYQITNMIQNLRNSTATVDQVVKLYNVALEIMPSEQRGNVVREMADYLVSKQRVADAYELYKKYTLPAAADKELAPSAPQTSVTYVNGALMNSEIQLANLAQQLKKVDELSAQIDEAVTAHPKWKHQGELLLAMLKRRGGDEEPLAAMGQRLLDDKTYAQSIAQQFTTLREELSQCEAESSLRIAVQVWEGGYPTAPGVVRYTGSSDKTRIAALWIKLKDRDKARTLLLEALTEDQPQVFSSHSAAEQIIRHELSIAGALRTNNFLLDALRVYDQALRRVPELDTKSYVRRSEGPRAYGDFQASLTKLLSEQPGEALDALMSELKVEQPDLSPFFVVADPPIVDDPRYVPSQLRNSIPPEQFSDPKRQLLTALLAYAERQDRLEELAGLVDARSKQLVEDAPPKQRDRLVCLHLVAALSDGEVAEDDRQALQQWLDRINEKPSLAGESETWLLALAALDNEATRDVGRQLTVAVAKSAASRDNAGRQQAAIAALRASGGDADKLIAEMLASRKGDPRVYFQVAQVHFQNKQYAEGAEALRVVWERAPELVVPQLRQLAEHYIKAKKIDLLAEGLASVTDRNLQSRYQYEIANVFQRLPVDPKSASQGLDLYFAATKFASQGNNSYFASYLMQYLRRLPKDAVTWDCYCRVVFPTKQHPGELARFANEFVELTQALNRTKEVDQLSRQAVKDDPTWQPKGELLMAMLARRAGELKPLIDVARKYKEDSGYASALQAEIGLLQNELVHTEDRLATELALNMWRQSASNEQGEANQATRQVAKLHDKLGDREAARRTLLEALARPFTINYETSPEYVLQMKIRRQQGLAQELSNLKFGREALMAYAQASAIDASAAGSDSSVKSLLDACRKAGRELIDQVVNNEAAESLGDLEQLLGEQDSDRVERELSYFLAVFDADSTTKETVTPDSMLLGLLAHAKDNDRLDGLREKLRAARERLPENSKLLALDCLLVLYAGQADQAAARLEQLQQLVKETPAQVDDAVWLVARAALAEQATRVQGLTLAEAVVRRADKSGDSGRQQAAAAALARALSSAGNADEVAERMRRLILGDSPTPQARLQLARLLFDEQKADDAVKALQPVWERQPEELLKGLSEIADMYVTAKATDKLALAIVAIEDQNLKGRYGNQLVNVANQLGQKKEYVEEAIKLFEAATVFSQEGMRDYAFSSLAGFLARNDRKEQAWQVYRRSVIPPTGPSTRVATTCVAFVDLSKDLNKLDELDRICQEAAETDASWQGGSDLLRAMASYQKDKREDLFVRLVERFRADDEYAKPLRASAPTLRTELARCESTKVLELGAELWQTEIDRLRSEQRGSSNDYRSYAAYADLLSKLGRQAEAGELLLEALDAPMPGYSPSYLPYIEFQRREFLAPKLTAAGRPVDAARLLRENLALAGSEIAQQRQLDRRMDAQRKLLRSALLEAMTDHLGNTLDELERELKKKEPRLEVFLATATPAWSETEVDRIPEHARSPIASHTQLLPAVLRHARHDNRLDGLAAAVEKARTATTDNTLLVALDLFIQQLTELGLEK